MILKNKRTRERIQLSYTEFQARFAQNIQTALESYIKTENAKSYFKINKTPESDFYFDLQWNLRLGGRRLKRQRACLMPPNKHHFGNSNWYIEKM